MTDIMSEEKVDNGKLKEQQHLMDALLNNVKEEWKPANASQDWQAGAQNISQEACALEIILHCKHKVNINGATVKVHNPSQVLDILLDVANQTYSDKSINDEQRFKNMEKAILTLQKVIEFSGVSYQDLTVQGTELNHKFNHVMDDIDKIMDSEKAKVIRVAIEGICRQQIENTKEAKNNAKSIIENEQGIDIAKFVSSKPLIGSHSQKRVKTVALAIANDLKAFQSSEVKLQGSDEHEIGKHSQFFNGISSMITDGILQAKTEKEAANILRLYIEVGKQCVKNNDFDSGQAISSAFSNSNIEKLFNGGKLTGLLDKIPKSSKKDFLELNELFSPAAEGKKKLKEKIDSVGNDWHTTPSPTFVAKLAGVDGMENDFNDKLEVASKAILPLIEQKKTQQAHPINIQPQTNFIHLLATTSRLTDDQQFEQMNKLRTDRKYDGKKFKSVEKVTGSISPNFNDITNDYVPKIVEDPFIEEVKKETKDESNEEVKDESNEEVKDELFVLEEPADMQSYNEPVHELDNIVFEDGMDSSMSQAQRNDNKAFYNIPPPLAPSVVKQAEEPVAQALNEHRQEGDPAVEQSRNVSRLTIMFENKIKQHEMEWKQSRKPEQSRQENESEKTIKPKSK